MLKYAYRKSHIGLENTTYNTAKRETEKEITIEHEFII